MAKIQTEAVTIKFNRLVRDSDKDAPSAINTDLITALEQVAQELVGDNIIVEVELS
jgi:hypothetical protein